MEFFLDIPGLLQCLGCQVGIGVAYPIETLDTFRHTTACRNLYQPKVQRYTVGRYLTERLDDVAATFGEQNRPTTARLGD